jgi:hypothetical protein
MSSRHRILQFFILVFMLRSCYLVASVTLQRIVFGKFIWTVLLKFTRIKSDLKGWMFRRKMITNLISYKKNMDALWRKNANFLELKVDGTVSNTVR